MSKRVYTDLVSSPPDDAGHMGSSTRPEDMMVVGDGEERPNPELDRDTAKTPQGEGGPGSAIVLLVVLLVIVLGAVAFIPWC